MATSTPTTAGQRIRTGIAGEFFVAAELSKRGWVATLTAKNMPGYDILAVRPDTERHVRIDVKTRSPAYPYAWRLSSGIRLAGYHDYLILVDLGEADQSALYWIVPARAAIEALTSYGQIRDASVEAYQGAWDLLDG